MRYLIVLLAFCGGCTHALTLYPRGGGNVAHGSVSSGSKSVTVELNGDTYTGHYVQGMTYGIGFGNSYAFSGARSASAFGTASTVGASNQYSFIATSGSKAVRCDAMFMSGHGNGVCADSDNRIYDLKIGD